MAPPDVAFARREMVRIGRLLYDRQLVVAAEGNLSVRLGGDLFLVTPAGAGKGFLTPEMLVTVDGEGRLVPPGPAAEGVAAASGGGEDQGRAPLSPAVKPVRPSSEWPLHALIYDLRADVQAVCHAHPPWATAFAAAGLSLAGCLLPEIIGSIGSVPLAPYGTPGTAELPAAVRPLIQNHPALLLANHGVVATGSSLAEAFFRLESVERLAQVTLLARLAGGERRLSRSAVDALLAGREAAGAVCAAAGEAPAESGEGPAATLAGPTTPAIDLEQITERIARQILAELRAAGPS